MSSRAVRKALKRLEQEEAAKKLVQQSAQDAASEDEEEEEDSHSPAPSNPFAMVPSSSLSFVNIS
jgi:Arc/MetJ-type ribon-helix-helix transcriptional regulator